MTNADWRVVLDALMLEMPMASDPDLTPAQRRVVERLWVVLDKAEGDLMALTAAAPPPAAESLASAHFAAEVVDECVCRTCGHLARFHVPGRCRKKRCGCGGWA